MDKAEEEDVAARYKDISNIMDEVMALPLDEIEAVVSSDDLQVGSEDAVYDLVLKWSTTHYPNLEERQEILGSRLARHIRFPFMTYRKLKKFLARDEFNHEAAAKLALEAIFFKAEPPQRQRILAADAGAGHRRFVERAYKYRQVKVVQFDLPRQQIVVYLDLKRDECAKLFPSGKLYSQAFHLGGQGFFLSAHCNMDKQESGRCFGLYVGMQEKQPSESFTVDYEFAARSKPSEQFVSKYAGNYTFTKKAKAIGYRNILVMPWTDFMAADCPYFTNGVLHLRADLTSRQ